MMAHTLPEVKNFLHNVVSVPWSPPQPLPLQPQTRLQWRRCADLPVEMRGAQAVLVGGKVCDGGGDTEIYGNVCLLLYDRGRDGWATLPPCPVRWFGLGQFKGHIITVGGISREGDTTNKLHCYKEDMGGVPTPNANTKEVSVSHHHTVSHASSPVGE